MTMIQQIRTSVAEDPWPWLFRALMTIGTVLLTVVGYLGAGTLSDLKASVSDVRTAISQTNNKLDRMDARIYQNTSLIASEAESQKYSDRRIEVLENEWLHLHQQN